MGLYMVVSAWSKRDENDDVIEESMTDTYQMEATYAKAKEVYERLLDTDYGQWSLYSASICIPVMSTEPHYYLPFEANTWTKLYFENFPEEDAEGNGVGSASYAEEIGTLTIEPDLEMWEALKQWAKRSGFTDITSGTNLD